MRIKYSKYKNVRMLDTFYPVLGDAAMILKGRKENKYMLSYMEDIIQKDPNFDIYIAQLGDVINFYISSLKANEEFVKLSPHKIDRKLDGDNIMLKIGGGSFSFNPTGQHWKDRRQSLLKAIGFNHVSRYLPLMIREADRFIDRVEAGVEIDFNNLCQKITFSVIAKILFGDDVDIETELCDYMHPNGRVEQLSLLDVYPLLTKCIFDEREHVLGMMFPFLKEYNLIRPFSTNRRNMLEYHRVLRKV